jgi:hypothetical protein
MYIYLSIYITVYLSIYLSIGKFNQSKTNENDDNISINSQDCNFSMQGTIPTATRNLRKQNNLNQNNLNQNNLSNNLNQHSIRTGLDSISYFNETPYEKSRSPTKEGMYLTNLSISYLFLNSNYLCVYASMCLCIYVSMHL